MAALSRLEHVRAAGADGLGEPALDVRAQPGLVALDREHVLGAARDDLLGQVRLAPGSVHRHDAA